MTRYAHAVHMNYSNQLTYYKKMVKKTERKDIIVVGAGVSGLAAAYELTQNGHKVCYSFTIVNPFGPFHGNKAQVSFLN